MIPDSLRLLRKASSGWRGVCGHFEAAGLVDVRADKPAVQSMAAEISLEAFQTEQEIIVW